MAQPNRSRFPLVVGGGMNKSGDPKKIQPNETRDCYNMFVRPGPRVEMRHGFLGEAVGELLYKAFRFVKPDGGYERIGFAGAAAAAPGSSGGLFKISGVWTEISPAHTIVGGDGRDYVNIFDKVYLVYCPAATSVDECQVVSYNGTAFDPDPFLLRGANERVSISGRTAEGFLNRIFFGHPMQQHLNDVAGTNGSMAYKFENAVEWTMSGGMSAAVTGTVRTLTISNGVTDQARSATKATLTHATETRWYTVVFDVQGIDAVDSIPMTMTLENSAGTTIYKTFEFEVPSRTTNPNWTTYTFETLLPGGFVNVYVEYHAGNLSRPTAPLKSFNVSDPQASGPLARGLQITTGRLTYEYRDVPRSGSLVITDIWPNRIIWCEADDPTEWRPANYIDLTEQPGPVRVLRKGAGRLMVYKDNAIWVFRGVANPDLPLQQERILFDIGCGGTRAIDRFEDRHYFIDSGRGEVYQWDISGEPQALCGDRMREEIFSATALVTKPVLQIDSDNKEVWVYTQTGKIFVYNLISKAWTRHDIRTTGGAAATINDLIYMKAESETRRAMWASINGTPAQVVKLTVGQTQDVCQGATTSPTASYEFHPMADMAVDAITVESLSIDHQVTATQAGSTTTALISRDGGATFPKSIVVTLAPLATTGVSQPMRVPVWQTEKDVVVKIEHTGLAGPEYFNFTGGDAVINNRGKGIQKTNPTAVSSTL